MDYIEQFKSSPVNINIGEKPFPQLESTAPVKVSRGLNMSQFLGKTLIR
jgi:hypothetical protein